MFSIVDSLRFNVEEIMKATNHLAKANEIGRGGYGCVFAADNLRCQGTRAAVKVLTKVTNFIRINSQYMKQL